MEIDAHNLPEEAGLLRQIVLQLLGVVDEKDRLLERVQHQLQQLLRQRYGPKRERVDENQLFSVCGSDHRRPRRKRPSRQPREAELPGPRNEHTSKVMDANRCRHLWSVVAWCSTWRKRNGNVGTARNRCSASERTLANDWSLSPPLSM
jgi:hypothetical protein